MLYIVAYLDRANVAFAKVPMMAELGLSEALFGFGAGMFFIGYLVLEIPGALIVERWSARRWIARILVTWGFFTAWVGLARSPREFYVARLLVGLAEAGFFPGIIVYLTHWFPPHVRARAMAGFIMAIPVALAIGAPISALLLRVSWLRLAGWRWVFILEGLPAVVLGIITLFYLTDHPREARWLSPKEREQINAELKDEKQRKRAIAHVTVWQALRQRNVIFLALALFFANIATYAFVFWLPSTIHAISGFSIPASTTISVIPFAAGVVSMLVWGWSSDRSGERRLHTLIPFAAVAVFLFLSAVPKQPFLLVMLWLCLTCGAIFAWPPSFWVLPTMTLGESAAAASIGLINSVGNLGGFVGPTVVGYILTKGFSHTTAVGFLSLCFLAGSGFVYALRTSRRA